RAIVEALGVKAQVIPMSDRPVRTVVKTPRGYRPFQQYMILDRAEPPIEGVEIGGAAEARPSPEALAALEAADAIVIGPPTPIVSIGPILLVGGMREAMRAARAPVVAISPFVGGRAVKGPTDAFMEAAGFERSAAGILDAYEGLIDGLVADEPVGAVSV